MEEKILVSPGEGQTLQDLAVGLLALADDPHDVESSPRAGGFLVPETLAGRYAFAADASGTVPAVAAEAEAKKPRAPRAPRARAAAKADTAATAEPKTTGKGKPRAARSRRAKGAKGDGGVSDA